MQNLRHSGIGTAAVATVIAAAILVALGVWQLERLAWKRGVLVQIASAEHAPPIVLGKTTPPLFTRVSLKGTLGPPAALYGAEVRGEGGAATMGAQLLEVLHRDDGPAVLLDLGWVPVDRNVAPMPIAGVFDGIGYVRLPEKPGWLSAPDDPEGRHFYTLDPAAIAGALQIANVAPFTIVAMGPSIGIAPQPASALPQPVNNHLSYALTWFGLAGSLIAVFVAWSMKRLRSGAQL